MRNPYPTPTGSRLEALAAGSTPTSRGRTSVIRTTEATGTLKTPTPNTHRAQQRRDQLFELAESVSLLPSTLTAPMKVLQLHRAGGASMEQYGEALATDASLV